MHQPPPRNSICYYQAGQGPGELRAGAPIPTISTDEKRTGENAL